MPDGCTCHGCGARYTLDVLVPGDVWARIYPGPKGAAGGGLLCPRCVVSRVEELERHSAYFLVPVGDGPPPIELDTPAG